AGRPPVLAYDRSAHRRTGRACPGRRDCGCRDRAGSRRLGDGTHGDGAGARLRAGTGPRHGRALRTARRRGRARTQHRRIHAATRAVSGASATRRARAAQAGILLALCAAALALLPLHDDVWWPGPPGTTQGWLATLLAAAYLAASAAKLLHARR